MSAPGALVGLVLALGVLSMAQWMMLRRKPDVLARIRGSAGHGISPSGSMSILRTLVMTRPDAREVADIELRLVQSGRGGDVRDYRLEQVVWMASGAGAGACLGTWLAWGEGNWLVVLALTVVGTVTGNVMCRRRLSSAIRARRHRLDQQLPSLAELLAFTVTAGQSPGAALSSVGDATSGDLAMEFREVHARARMGMGLEQSLRELSRQAGSPAVGRFVDGLTMCLERGTPVAEVLRAQAADVRADHRRVLMEQAGRKDIAMLLPVVFLILPIVVVIALYPGIAGISLLVP